MKRPTRRTMLGMVGGATVALAGCFGSDSPNRPPDGAVAVENLNREESEADVTVTDADGATILDRTFTVGGGEVVSSEPVITERGEYEVTAIVGDATRTDTVEFRRRGPNDEEIFGYILVFFDGPPTEITITGPPLGSETPSPSSGG